MADRFPGKIEIGGTVVIETVEQRKLVEKALTAFAEYCSPEWGGARYGTMSIKDAMDEANEQGLLLGVDEEARYGEFEQVEDACREAGIAYDRHSSARYEYDAEISRWRPNMNAAFVTMSDEGGGVCIAASEVKELIKETLEEDILASLTDRISLFKRKFASMVGCDIAPLEPLKIIDNAPKVE